MHPVPSARRRRLLTATSLIWAAPVFAQSLATEGPWLSTDGHASAAASEALALLRAAADDGLNPQDYAADALSRHAAGLPSTAEASVIFVRDLQAALLQFARDLRHGRVDPRALGFQVPRMPMAEPGVAQLAAAAREGQLAAWVAAQRPRISQYARLRDALAHMRHLAGVPWAALPGVAASVRPTQSYVALPALRERLSLLGDLSLDAPPHEEDRLDEALSAALARFQARHGLAPDGVLGAATLRALNVPPAHRVRQIELALERLRWLPDLGARRWIGINIPMYRLWAADLSGEQPLLTMAVVVGKSLNTQTPVLQQDMRHVIFRPYWNVPGSIVRGEILPALQRNPGYLAQHDMELVRGGSDSAVPVPATAANLALLRDGQLRLRQRPGPKNSLGLVKFIFPNDHNVYLHGTPAQSLFARARRDFSHGCVRVEDPVALAEWVLDEQPGWPRERVLDAMNAAHPQQVNLRQPLPVLLFYLTAMVMPGTQALHFAEDVYGHDARLLQALAKRGE